MTVTEIIGVAVVVICVAVLVGVMIHWMKQDNNMVHTEMVIRVYANREFYAGEVNYWLARGWKVKFQSEPMIRESGQEYIEYVLYKDEPIKKGDKHDSKQDSL